MEKMKFLKITKQKLLVFMVLTGGLLLNACNISNEKTVSEEEFVETESIQEMKESKVIHTEIGYMLQTTDGKQIGPYQYICTDDIYHSWKTVARYIGQNGFFGYINKDGNILTDAIFTEASEMRDGIARVKEKNTGIYYINSEGERITRDYKEGSFEFESQGCYARVRTEDGLWAIINSKDEFILQGADYIPKLPDINDICSAVVAGNAILIRLEFGEEAGGSIVAEMKEFSDISAVYDGSFALVQNKEGLWGVVDREGKVIISPVYQKIDYNTTGEQVIFFAQKNDDTYERLYLDK